MPLSEVVLNADLQRAMKERDMVRVYVLRGVLTAAKNLRVERRAAELAESDLVQIVRRELRQRDEAAAFAVKAGRDDLVAQGKAEQDILAAYVPAQLDEAALEGVVRALVAELKPSNMGPVMAALRERHGGQFDGKLASEIARRVLAEPAA